MPPCRCLLPQGETRSVVGFWSVTYTSGGAVWDMSFVTFHSDGTDYDNDMAPPATGDICEGVWKAMGRHTVKRHHVGWLWESTTILQGTFTLDEMITLGANGNSYTGTFSFQPLDLNAIARFGPNWSQNLNPSSLGLATKRAASYWAARFD